MKSPGAAVAFGREFARKTIHLATAVIPLLYARGVERQAMLVILSLVSAVAFAVEAGRRVSPRVQRAFECTVGPLLRDREHRAITGATWLAVASLAIVLAVRTRPAVAALWCMTVGDPAATLVGRGVSAMRRTNPSKTMIGSAACVLASFAGVWLVAGYDPLPAFAVAISVALAERFPGPFDDNLTIAIAGTAAATLLA